MNRWKKRRENGKKVVREVASEPGRTVSQKVRKIVDTAARNNIKSCDDSENEQESLDVYSRDSRCHVVFISGPLGSGRHIRDQYVCFENIKGRRSGKTNAELHVTV